MSPNDKSSSSSTLSPASANEVAVMQKCWDAATWHRSVPMATLSGAAVFVAVRRGKLKANARFGPWLKVGGVAFASYWLGKVSYLLGRECQDKFLQDAPESEIARHIQEQRGIRGTEPTASGVVELEEVVVTEDKEAEEEMTLTNKERRILEECRKVSIYYYSVPLSLLFGWSALKAQAAGYLSESRRLSPNFKRLPKVILGATLGYFVGQVAYMFSSDCSDRFLREAPTGSMAKTIRQLRRGDQVGSEGAASGGGGGGRLPIFHPKQTLQERGSWEDLKIDPFEAEQYITPNSGDNQRDLALGVATAEQMIAEGRKKVTERKKFDW